MKQYFYIDANNQQVGPITEETLKEMVQCGTISSQSYIWTEGFTKWVPFGVVFPESEGEMARPLPSPTHENDAPESPAAEMHQVQYMPEGKTRKNLIIGGVVALIAALSISTYFVSDSGDSSSPVSATAKKKRFKPRKTSKEKAVKELRELGVISSELDIQGRVGSRAMANACAQGNINITELLLAGGINVAQMNDFDVLLCAAKNGHPEIVKLLLAVPGIDVNKECKDWYISKDDLRSTPLERAAENGHTEVVRLLLAAPGIDVNANVPLQGAAINNHPEVVKLLLAAPGIDVNAGFVLWNASRCGSAECVKILLEVPEIAEGAGGSLEEAAKNGHAEVVKLLLAVPGIDVNKGGPLTKAAENGHAEVVKLLLAAPGIDVNLWNPLAEAAKNGHAEVVKLLLAVPGIEYTDALYYAAEHGHVEIVKLLLAVPGIEVTWEHLAVATENGHTEIVKLLRAAGAHK